MLFEDFVRLENKKEVKRSWVRTEGVCLLIFLWNSQNCPWLMRGMSSSIVWVEKYSLVKLSWAPFFSSFGWLSQNTLINNLINTLRVLWPSRKWTRKMPWLSSPLNITSNITLNVSMTFALDQSPFVFIGQSLPLGSHCYDCSCPQDDTTKTICYFLLKFLMEML